MSTEDSNSEDNTPPEPPEGLANWVVEPLQAQDVEALEQIIGYCEELIEHKTRPVIGEEDDTEGTTVKQKPQKEQSAEERREAQEEVEQLSKEEMKDLSDEELRRYGAIEIRKIPCGPGCDQCPHGPYRYLKTRNSKGTPISIYAGKA
jgi:hypothetical protein